MTNEEKAVKLEEEAAKNQGWADSYLKTNEMAAAKFGSLAESFRSGAEALRWMERLKGFICICRPELAPQIEKAAHD